MYANQGLKRYKKVLNAVCVHEDFSSILVNLPQLVW